MENLVWTTWIDILQCAETQNVVPLCEYTGQMGKGDVKTKWLYNSLWWTYSTEIFPDESPLLSHH